MTRIQSFCVFLLAASAVACAPAAKVGFDYDPSANFKAYHTYDWMAGEQEKTGDRSVDSTTVDIRIRNQHLFKRLPRPRARISMWPTISESTTWPSIPPPYISRREWPATP
jgi:hypothetical protein